MTSMELALSGTQSFAPLSQSQTISICKHLQEQIDALRGNVGGLQHDLSNTANSLQGFRDSINNSPFENSMKDALLLATTSIESSRKENARTNQVVARLQAGLELSNENLTALREGQKVTNVNLQKVIQDLSQTTGTTNSVREALEKHVFGDIEKLRDGLGRTNLLIQHLQQEGELRKASVQTQKEEIRALHSVCQNTRDELAKANTHVHLVEQRFCELNKAVRETKQGLDETAAARARLQDDHDHTKSLVSEIQATLKKVGGMAKHVHDGLEATKMDLSSTKVQLQSSSGTGDSSREELSQVTIAVRALKEAQERMNSQHASLASAFDQTRAIVAETKRGLKATNSLVLPNLQLEQSCGPSMMSTTLPSPSQMSSTMGGSRVLPSSKKSSPRPGSSDRDRMAWTS